MPFAGEQAGVAMVGMQPVPPPRVVAEDDVGSQHPNPSRDLGPLRETRLELAVAPSEEDDLAGRAERLGCGPLLVLAAGDERLGVGGDVPRALRSVGAMT